MLARPEPIRKISSVNPNSEYKSFTHKQMLVSFSLAVRASVLRLRC